MFNSKKPERRSGSHRPAPASTTGSRPDESQSSSPQFLVFSEERFHALFDAAPLAIGIVRDGVLLYVNPALASLIGVADAADLIGQYARDYVVPSLLDEVTKHTRTRIESINKGEGGLGFELPLHETMIARIDGTRVPVRTEIAPLHLPDGDAIISFTFDLSQEKRAHDEIRALLQGEQRSSHFARHLQELSQAFSWVASPEEVASIAVELCAEAVGAIGTIFVVPRESEDGKIRLRLLQSRGYSAEAVAGWSQMDATDQTPVALAFREKEAVWVENVEDQVQLTRFPPLINAPQRTGTRAVAALPLRLDKRITGVLGFSFDTAREFDTQDKRFMETMAASCAQALERARLDAEARLLARRQRESLALLNTLLDSAPVGFCLFDREHRYVLVNAEVARINEVSVEAHLGKRPTEMLFATQMGERVESLLEEVWQRGIPSGTIEFLQGTPQSSEFRHCTLALYPIRVGGPQTQSREMLGVGAILIEQTERMRTENERERLLIQLEIERARFEAILRQMPSGVIIAEAPSGRLILRNEQAVEIWGYNFGDADAKDLLPPEYRRSGFDAEGRQLGEEDWPLARALRAGETVRDVEIVIERGGDQFGVIRANSAPIRDSDGAITAGIVVFDNVTERARRDTAQRFLAEAGAVLVSALDETEIYGAIARLCVPRVADWCAFIAPQSRTTFAITAVTGADSQDEQATSLLENALRKGVGVREDILSAMQDQRGLLRAASGIGAEWVETLSVREVLFVPVTARGRSLGAMMWISTSPKNSFDAMTLELAEEIGRRVGLSADNARLLQEAQQARDAAQRARDEAEAANRAKDEFLAVVSHELRTPLTPILGWLELLRSPDIDITLRSQAYDVIERNAIAQAQLVNDILDVSRITTGKLRLDLKDVALNEIVTRSVESLRTVWSDKKLKVEQRIEPHIMVLGDASRIGQVVWNLLQNAIKFTPAGGEIELSLCQQSRADGTSLACLEVRDTGSGIEADLVPHVFERFRQGDSSSTRKAGGLGLGLAIVRHIVELHGGYVSVRSPGLGQGTTFRVEFPLLAGTLLPEPPPVYSHALGGRLRGNKILVVDDEPDTREMLARLLEEAGATVRVASGGRMALEVATQFTPTLIVSDIGMPDMDGLELRRALLARGLRAPAIALTAYAAGTDQALAKEAGFERYLAKPVGTQELIEVAVDLLST